MRRYIRKMHIPVLVMYLLVCAVVNYLFAVQDIPKPVNPDYDDVDVFLECDWGANENMVQAKVFDKTMAEKPYLLIFKRNGTYEEVSLIKGIIVRIFDHDSGKLLKTYIGADYQK